MRENHVAGWKKVTIVIRELGPSRCAGNRSRYCVAWVLTLAEMVVFDEGRAGMSCLWCTENVSCYLNESTRGSSPVGMSGRYSYTPQDTS